MAAVSNRFYKAPGLLLANRNERFASRTPLMFSAIPETYPQRYCLLIGAGTVRCHVSLGTEIENRRRDYRHNVNVRRYFIYFYETGKPAPAYIGKGTHLFGPKVLGNIQDRSQRSDLACMLAWKIRIKEKP